MYRIKFQFYNPHLKRACDNVEMHESLDDARRRAAEAGWTIVECVQVTAPLIASNAAREAQQST